MFSQRRGEDGALHWRGPLLAAAVFAGVFALLLLMAHQTRADASDTGSSFREDPYGASLLFNSYGRAGYQVKRSQDQDSLSREDPSNTTAFFIGGHLYDDAKAGKEHSRMTEKLRRSIEAFLAGGGRVVLVAPAGKLKSDSQNWEVEDEWGQNPDASGPGWISPDPRNMPDGSEQMYVSGDAPWLKTDASWTPLYTKPVDTEDGPAAHVYMAMRKVGHGEIIVASQESFLLNEAVKTRPDPILLDFLTGGREVIWVDETLHGLHQEQGILWLVERYRLQAALLLCWATLLALLWSTSGNLVRRPARNQNLQLIRNGEAAGVAARRLLQRSVGPEKVLSECWEQFRRRSPQEAEAISADPGSGPQLSTALSQPPLAGYTRLSRLIADYRAGKGLVRARHHVPGSSISSMKAGPEEVRNT